MKNTGLYVVRTVKTAAILSVSCLWLFTADTHAQEILKVVEGKMAAGFSADARIIVRNALEKESAGSQTGEKLLLYQAILTSQGDSALKRLEKIAGDSERKRNEITAARLCLLALERLGDLALSRGDYKGASESYRDAAGMEKDTGARQGLLVKAARAELRLGEPHNALKALREALELGGTPVTPMVRYWRGIAKQAVGDHEGAAAEYMAAYMSPSAPYQFASLYRLTAIHGKGKSRTAGDWRKRWRDTSFRTVFGPTILPPPHIRKQQQQQQQQEKLLYSIQLGAFSDHDRARDHAARVRRLGIENVNIRKGPDSLYRVRIEGLAPGREVGRMVSILKKNKLEYQVIKP